MNSLELSIVIPCFNTHESLVELIERIDNSLPKTNFEVILVDDGSIDDTWTVIEALSKNNDKVEGIKLSRNFGQHKAIRAGLEKSKGLNIVVMDCDLQDRPEDIPELLCKIQNSEAEIVLTLKKSREHSNFKNFTAAIYRTVFNSLINSNIEKITKEVGGFSICSRKVIDSYLKINDAHGHYLNFIIWIGFNKTFIEVEHERRKYGESNYNLRKLIIHAIDGITSESDKLLKISLLIGLFFTTVTFASMIIILYKKLTSGFLPGWTSILLASLISITINLVSFGILGAYIGKIFEQVKQRPHYIVEKDTQEKERAWKKKSA